MQKRKLYAISAAAILSIAGASVAMPTPVGRARANSAPYSWRGAAGSAVITVGQCPLTVVGERLAFDIADTPKAVYESVADFLAYDGKVTAEYEFYNPSDYDVTATLLFPLGERPEYEIVDADARDAAKAYAQTCMRYPVTVDGNPTDKKLRHTYYKRTSTFIDDAFSIGDELKKLCDGYAADDCFSYDLPVTEYVCSVTDIPDDVNEYRTFLRVTHSDSDSVKILYDASSPEIRSHSNELKLRVANGDEVRLYVIGDAAAPEIKFYDDKIQNSASYGSLDIACRHTTFGDFVIAHRTDDSISDTDFYNAAVYALNQDNTDALAKPCDALASLESKTMLWYEYSLHVPAKASVVNSVTAPAYPLITRIHDAEMHTYAYLLSPAACWAQFGTLDIEIMSPLQIKNSSVALACENGVYTARLDGLPQTELTFTTVASEEYAPLPKEPRDYTLLIVFGIWAGLAATVAVAVIALRVKNVI